MASWNHPTSTARSAFIGTDAEYIRHLFSEYWRHKLAFDAAGKRAEQLQRTAELWPSRHNRRRMLSAFKNAEYWLKGQIHVVRQIEEIANV